MTTKQIDQYFVLGWPQTRRHEARCNNWGAWPDLRLGYKQLFVQTLLMCGANKIISQSRIVNIKHICYLLLLIGLPPVEVEWPIRESSLGSVSSCMLCAFTAFLIVVKHNAGQDSFSTKVKFYYTGTFKIPSLWKRRFRIFITNGRCVWSPVPDESSRVCDQRIKILVETAPFVCALACFKNWSRPDGREVCGRPYAACHGGLLYPHSRS